MIQKTYFVLPVEMLSMIDFNTVEEPNINHVKKSLDGNLALLEYTGDVEGFGITYLNYEQATELVNSPEWRPEADPPVFIPPSF